MQHYITSHKHTPNNRAQEFILTIIIFHCPEMVYCNVVALTVPSLLCVQQSIDASYFATQYHWIEAASAFDNRIDLHSLNPD